MSRFLLAVAVLAACAGCAGFPLQGRLWSLKTAALPRCFTLQSGNTSGESMREGGIGVYFKDRGNDFADIFGLSLTIGFGALANVRVTQAIQVGGFFWGGSKFGFIGREGGAWSESVVEFGLPGFYIRSVEILPGGGNISRMRTERGQSLWIFCGDEGIPYDRGYDRKFWQVGATAHAAIVGLDFSLNLKELLDFLLGWFTVDISRDDTANRPTEEREEDNSPSSPAP